MYTHECLRKHIQICALSKTYNYTLSMINSIILKKFNMKLIIMKWQDSIMSFTLQDAPRRAKSNHLSYVNLGYRAYTRGLFRGKHYFVKMCALKRRSLP